MFNKNVLASAIEIVAFLFAAFGHFLLNIAPPEEVGISFAVGLSSLITLCLLLYIKALTWKLPVGKYKRRWLLVSGIAFVIAIASSIFYRSYFDEHTFLYPSGPSETIERHIAGEKLTQVAASYQAKNQISDMGELVAKFGGLLNRGRVWESFNIIKSKAEMILTWNYIAMVLFFALTIFSLTEGILVTPVKS